MFKDELQTIRNMYNQYVNVTPQELYTKCVEGPMKKHGAK